MPEPVVHRRRYAFETEARWLRAAEAALAAYARSDDVTALDALVRRWDEAVDAERVAARIEPSEEAWAELALALAKAGMAPAGPRRDVYRDPWERLGRSLRRLARLEALSGPAIILENEREIAARASASLDETREPVGAGRRFDRIARTDGREVLDLSQFAMAVAELAGGAFPRDLGDGAAVDRELSEELFGRMQTLARLDELWKVHGTWLWESGVHASALVPDAELWSPASMRGVRALDLPASGASESCAAWRALLPALPVGDRGGPMFVEARGERCVVSFVLVTTPGAMPFLPHDDSDA